MKRKLEKEILDAMSRDILNWRGPFYFNRKDPRVLVPKFISSFGWTLNFANPYSYISLVAIILIIVLSQFLA